jgi:hypothetical protein
MYRHKSNDHLRKENQNGILLENVSAETLFIAINLRMMPKYGNKIEWENRIRTHNVEVVVSIYIDCS